MIHVLLASSLPLAIFFLSWLARGRRTSLRALIVLPIACLISGAWAVTPDMPRALGNKDLYFELHRWKHCNVWWFHCEIDKHDKIDSSMLFPVLFVLAAVAVMGIAWLELRRAERGDG